MIKRQEALDPNSCWNKAREDEMVFVLLERDLAAPLAIRQWEARRVQLGKNKLGDEQMREAQRCRIHMSTQQRRLGLVEKHFKTIEMAAPRIIPTDLNDFAYECHEDNLKWWHDPSTGQPIQRNDGQLIMLMVSELAEAHEGLRRNLMDEHLPHRRSVEVELADCLIRIFDYAGAHGLDLQGAYEEKRAYNAIRADHQHKNRLLEGGKKF